MKTLLKVDALFSLAAAGRNREAIETVIAAIRERSIALSLAALPHASLPGGHGSDDLATYPGPDAPAECAFAFTLLVEGNPLVMRRAVVGAVHAALAETPDVFLSDGDLVQVRIHAPDGLLGNNCAALGHLPDDELIAAIAAIAANGIPGGDSDQISALALTPLAILLNRQGKRDLAGLINEVIDPYGEAGPLAPSDAAIA